ncbi:MAG: PRC-barrel domain-containing protein, partial [Hyphomonadaceae bacterium]
TGTRVTGSAVYTADGDRIGHVEDLSIEKLSGRVRYALMSFGGFLGIGDKLHPLPWDVLRYDTGRDGYVVPLSKAQLNDAPSYTPAELQAFGGRDVSYREGLYKYYLPYGAIPYW